MNRLIFIICALCSITIESQILSKQDSLSIAFKAKLLTTSEYGISYSKENILQNIEQQETYFLNTLYKNFVFLKVEYSQKYNQLHKGNIVRFGDCNYYLAFNTQSYRFYRLGGFDSLDIDTFIQDLEWLENQIFYIVSGEEIEEIDIRCLYNYFELSLRKRIKRGYTCLDNCNLTTTITKSH